MSLGKTLVKVAIGIAIAKGVSTMAKGRQGQTAQVEPGRGTPYGRGSSGGLDTIMDDIMGKGGAKGGASSDMQFDADSTSTGRASTNPLEDLLGQLTGQKSGGSDGGMFGGGTTTRTTRANAPKNGLEDLLESLTGGKTSGGGAADQGGLGGGLGGALGGGAAGGALGGILEALLGGKAANAGTASGGRIGSPQQQEELAAALGMRAMLQAVKSDGKMDEKEKRRLIENMKDASQEEAAFVNAELARPVDINGLARLVPSGMEEQVYVISLMAIDLDSREEAQYLHDLSKALELSPAEVNALHDRAGAPHLFR